MLHDWHAKNYQYVQHQHFESIIKELKYGAQIEKPRRFSFEWLLPCKRRNVKGNSGGSGYIKNENFLLQRNIL